MTCQAPWKVKSLAALSLFDQLKLDDKQILELPKRITDKIFKGFSDVINESVLSECGPNVKKVRFTAKSTADGNISISYDGGRSYFDAGTIKKELLVTMRQACDAARIQFPSAFNWELPLRWPKLSIESNSSIIPEARSIFLDANSLVRNSLAVAGIGAPLVALSGMGAGMLGIAAATDNLREAAKRYDCASEIGDTEGKMAATLGIWMNRFYAILSLGMIGSNLSPVYNVFSTDGLLSPISGFSFLSEGAAVAFSLGLIASTLHEWSYISSFRDDLGLILQRNVPTQEKVTQGLEFLQQQLAITEEDVGELMDNVLEYDQAINNKCLEKYYRLIRRVGPEVANRIANSRELLLGVKAGDLEAIQQAKELIELADSESFKKRVREITCLVISILAIAAVSLALAFGVFDLELLYAINAGLWLSVDSNYLNDVVGKAIYNRCKPSDEKRWGPMTAPDCIATA